MPSLPLGTDVQIYEIPPQGMIRSKKAGMVTSYWPKVNANDLVWHRLQWLAARQRQRSLWDTSSEEEIRAYSIPLVEVFHLAARSYPAVSIDSDVMAGAPCIQGTRIPVYMILDAIEYQGSLDGALESYPRLTLDQVKEAIGFAKLVVECPIEHENTTTP
jgi:uncharacterized protein (DUF433 family)